MQITPVFFTFLTKYTSLDYTLSHPSINTNIKIIDFEQQRSSWTLLTNTIYS